jgi:xylulokinase
LVRAVLEGVAFGLRDSLDLVRGLGVEVSSARASGGGARSELWLRICASVLGVPIERTVVEEGSAFGAALLAGVASGIYANVHEAVAAAVHTRDVVEPEPTWSDAYAELHLRYSALYPALRELDGATVGR